MPDDKILVRGIEIKRSRYEVAKQGYTKPMTDNEKEVSRIGVSLAGILIAAIIFGLWLVYAISSASGQTIRPPMQPNLYWDMERGGWTETPQHDDWMEFIGRNIRELINARRNAD
jgi:hypothetical protein